MRTKGISLLAAAGLALAAMALPARAEETVMTAAIQAGSLHGGPLDMVAYWTEGVAGALVVTATFRERDAAEAEPLRVVMLMADGDDVSFSAPGYMSALYRFRREGDRVTASVQAPARAPLRPPLRTAGGVMAGL